MPSAPLHLPITVLLVDDQRAILAGVSALIDSETPHMQVAGRACCGVQALALAHSTRPDVIVLDADLAGEDGLALIPQLHAACRPGIVVFTCLADPDVRQRALRLGAAGFVSKTAAGEELIAAIRGATG